MLLTGFCLLRCVRVAKRLPISLFKDDVTWATNVFYW